MSTTEEPRSPALTPTEQTLQEKILAAPVEWPQSTKSYLEDFVTTLLPTQAALEAMVARIAHPVGFWLIVPDDLTAQTGVYEYTHPLTGLKYLYCNGAAASQTTYADLYALWGASKYGADSGGNFLLPDTRGRSLWLAGTHTNTDVGDTDGQSEATREPKHKHTAGTLGISGSPGVGTLALPNHAHSITDPGHYHDYTGVTSSQAGQSGTANFVIASQPTQNTTSKTTGITIGNPTTLPAITGAPSSGTLGVSGEAGSGMGGSDAVAHIVIGSLVVRF